MDCSSSSLPTVSTACSTTCGDGESYSTINSSNIIVEEKAPKKSVTFGPPISDDTKKDGTGMQFFTAATLQKSELTKEELSELWYTFEDLEANKVEILLALSVLQSNASPSKKREVCARGLEMQTDRVRKFDALKAHRALMEEQRRQKSVGVNDPDQLAQVYRAKAIFCEETALKMGRQDEDDAQLALAELDSKDKTSNPSMKIFKTMGKAFATTSPKFGLINDNNNRKRIRNNKPRQKSKSVPTPSTTSTSSSSPKRAVGGRTIIGRRCLTPTRQQQERRNIPKESSKPLTKPKSKSVATSSGSGGHGRSLTPTRQEKSIKKGSQPKQRTIKDILSLSGHRRKDQYRQKKQQQEPISVNVTP